MPNPTYGQLAAGRRDLKGKARAAAELEAWHQSPEGVTAYKAAFSAACEGANKLGMDHGITFDGHVSGGRLIYGGWRVWPLPAKQYRYGADHTCGVIHPVDRERTLSGHGPEAIRPASPVGPDHHGGPWIGREAALEEIRAWQGGEPLGPNGLLPAGHENDPSRRK